MKATDFDYINGYYGLSLGKGTPVLETSTGRSGIVTKADGAHIWIHWDGLSKAIGPYHPTSNLTYPKPDGEAI